MKKAFLVVGAGVALLPLVLLPISEAGDGPSFLLPMDIAAVGLLAAGVIVSRKLPEGSVGLVSGLACGALVGACLVGPLRTAPYVLVAALALGVVAVRSGVQSRWGRAGSAGTVMVAVIANSALLWPNTLGRYRPVPEAGYRALDLRVHTLMADVPVHDVWRVRLPGNGAEGNLRDMDQALAAYGGIGGQDRVALVAVLGAYFLVSRVFDWNNDACAHPGNSVRSRLTEEDQEGSTSPSDRGPFVYQFDREALIEIQTCAGHAIYAYAMVPTGDGQLLYWAAYAMQVGRFTPYYMAVIDPVRRLVVFPSLMERFERAWRAKWGQGPGSAHGVQPARGLT